MGNATSRVVLVHKEEKLAIKECAIVKVHCVIVTWCFITVYEWCIDIASALCISTPVTMNASCAKV